MRNSDYPDDLTCHVRDPKVWKENGTYYMVQGARANEDVGQVLVFESEDKVNWKFGIRKAIRVYVGMPGLFQNRR